MDLLLFWSATVLIVYIYILFPALVFLRRLLWYQAYKSTEITLSGSLIIAAHNETNTFGTKLNNILLLDNRRDRLELLNASDGSNDGTDGMETN